MVFDQRNFTGHQLETLAWSSHLRAVRFSLSRHWIESWIQRICIAVPFCSAGGAVVAGGSLTCAGARVELTRQSR